MGYVTKLVEVIVCEHCGSEDCYNDRCLIPPPPYVEPDRVEVIHAKDPFSGIEFDYRVEYRKDSVSVSQALAHEMIAKPRNLAG